MTVTLLQGDCLEILPTLADKSVDAIITDLPYGTTACKWDVIIPLEPMWAQVKRLCKGAFVTTASQPFTSVLVCSNLDWFRYECSWNKKLPTGFLDANRKPLKVHENVLVFYNGHHVYNPQKQKGQPYSKPPQSSITSVYHKAKAVKSVSNGERYPVSIIEISNAHQAAKEHPTQKPVALYEYLIRTYTNEGGTVLDFCAGSGTTGVAAVNTGRNAILIEREPEYFAIMQKRIAAAEAQMVMPL